MVGDSQAPSCQTNVQRMARIFESKAQISDPESAPKHQSTLAVVNKKDHKYRSLNPRESEIRLVQVLPEDGNGRIRCQTRICALNKRPSYIALSYTWGSPPAQHTIELDGRQFHIRKSLWRFLTHIKNLKTLVPECFWIDAICINQQDLDERAQQVGLMAQIFKGASKVLVWLGPAYDNSDAAMAHLSKSRSVAADCPSTLKVWAKHSGKAISELCTRAYWRRLWVFQELLLAQQIELMCGYKVIRWEAFQELLLTMNLVKPGTRLADKAAYITASSSPAMTIVGQVVRDIGERSLFNLMLSTRDLRCAEIRDKMYGLLGVATSGCQEITADYSLTIPALLNNVLREHHKSKAPTEIDQVVAQYHKLSECLKLSSDTQLKMYDGYTGLLPIPLDPDLALFQNLLNRDAEPFLWSIFWNHECVLRVILRAYKGSRLIQGLLDRAAIVGNETVVRIMLHLFPDVADLWPVDLSLAFDSAVQYRHTKIIELLGPVRGVSGNGLDKHGRTALHRAASVGHTHVLKALIDTGKTEINAQSNDGSTALHSAISGGHLSAVTALLDTGMVELNYQNNEGYTALHLAAVQGHTPTITALLQTGLAEVDLKDVAGMTALQRAAHSGYESAVELLIDPGKARVDLPNHQGWTALHIAAHRGHVPVVDTLLSTGKVNVNAPTCEGWTALHAAAQKGRVLVVTALVNTGIAEVNLQADNGHTALHLAVNEGHTSVVTALLDTGRVDVNLETSNGHTALHLAAARGFEGVVTSLLKNEGLDLARRDKDGHTALEIASKRHYTTITEALRARTNKTGSDIQRALGGLWNFKPW